MNNKQTSSVPFLGIANAIAVEQAQEEQAMAQRYALGLCAAVATPTGQHAAFYAAPLTVISASRRHVHYKLTSS